MENKKTIINAKLPGLKFRPCCLLADLVFPSNIPVLGQLWPKIMKDLSSSNLRHISGISWIGFILRREHSGTVYTCKGGFIDLGHLRDFVDLTRHYYYALKKLEDEKGVIKNGKTFPIFKTHGGIKGTGHIKQNINVNDADGINQLIFLARQISYDVSVMYEIQTYHSTGIGDRHSSFSPEDLTSNFLGTYIGGKALKEQIELAKKESLSKEDANQTFDNIVTTQLIVLLSKLNALDVDKTLEAYQKINERWVDEGLFKFIDLLNSDYLKRRNFDVSPVKPWLVDELSECSDNTFPTDIDLALPDNIRTLYEARFKVPFSKIVPSNLPVPITVTEFKDHSSDKFDEYVNEVKNLAKQQYGINFDKR